ncbi:hypothetical protein REPUB_Repub04eG0034800 [Reevesia pubescens]
MIHSALGLCLIAGPRDKVIVEKANDVILQVPVLKYLDLCIQRFIQDNERIKLHRWEYKEYDYILFSEILASHFRNKWLSNKKKLKALTGDRMSRGLEAASTFLFADVALPIKNVLVIWKLHSLSIILLIGMAVLKKEKSIDVYQSLQELYG